MWTPLCCAQCSTEDARGARKMLRQREGTAWGSFTETPPRFKSTDSAQNISVPVADYARCLSQGKVVPFEPRPAL